MKAPLSWLADFVEIAVPAEELAERLTTAGLEVGSITRIGDTWDRERILVGRIVRVEQHPNADRLTLPTVEYGDGREIRLVTGAPNIRVGTSGQKVPVALVGARLIDGHSDAGGFIVLKPAKLRGVESLGMVCSERELGLSEEHGGIMILPDDAPVGMPLADYLGDTVLDVEPTPDMSRCLSILGVAREVAAVTGARVRYTPEGPPAGTLQAADLVSIVIEDPELAARYCGTWVGGLKAGLSPFRVRRRLAAAGMRPISNLVDATNYVMLELGQPLHAFDYAVLRERAGGHPPVITVRSARDGERIVTLDGVERPCTPDTLLITDARGPIAVAGVMGGQETEVREETSEVLLEAATFHHASIRRTAQRLKLPSQASLRFGKGLPASLAAEAAARVTRLVAEWGGGEAASGIVDCHPRPQPPLRVFLGAGDVRRVLGYEIPAPRIVELLERLEFDVRPADGGLDIGVPQYRLDVTIPADLVEEVARLEGYENLPSRLLAEPLPPQERDLMLETERDSRTFLAASGLQEVITYGLTDEATSRTWLDQADPGLLSRRGDFMRVVNPLSEDRTVMRVSLLPEMLACLRSNRRFQRRVAIFEVGRVFLRRAAGRPDEPRRLGILLWGLREEPWWGCPEPQGMDFFDLKGIVTGFADRLHVPGLRLAPSSRGIFAPGRGVELLLGDEPLGMMGELESSIRRALDLGEERVVVAELDLEPVAAARFVPRMISPSRFPPVTRDLAVVVDDDLPAGDVEAAIREAGGELLSRVTLFDLYRGAQVPAGKKSLAFSLTFQAPDRTLTEDDAAGRREAILAILAERFKATLR